LEYIGAHRKRRVGGNLHPDGTAEPGLALSRADLVVEPRALEVIAGPDCAATGELEIEELARVCVRESNFGTKEYLGGNSRLLPQVNQGNIIAFSNLSGWCGNWRSDGHGGSECGDERGSELHFNGVVDCEDDLMI
jgi:hypothetical protein